MKTTRLTSFFALIVCSLVLFSCSGTKTSLDFSKNRTMKNKHWVLVNPRTSVEVEQEQLKEEPATIEEAATVAPTTIATSTIAKEAVSVEAITMAPPAVIEPIENNGEVSETIVPTEDATSFAAEVPASSQKKEVKRKAAKVRSTHQHNPFSSDEELILLVILSIIISPLAVYLYDNAVTTRFWINLLLYIFGGGLVFGVHAGFGLLLLAAIVHALLIVFGKI